MRLIDADEIIQKTYGVVIEDMFHMHETVEVVSTIDIEKAPTVQAIPIELYEQVRGERDVAVEQLKSLNIELFEKPYLKAITIEWINKWLRKYGEPILDDGICKMIEDWEEENGRSE